ncbi:MAG: hypothetical protein M3552_00075 [Planctomycetota bacterium]|nr:hypothetical protein [Planctomycetaceae bacterium]MDQ3329042.1 hypothetical protein [Planctomycetota bacterium]
MRRFVTQTTLLLLVATCGCSSLSGGWKTFLPGKKWVVADAHNPAVEVACVWQPGEGRGPQGVPARGFSGQIYFFTRKDAEPALVNGNVRVYLFADRGTQEERGKPLHEYDFTPEQWSAHATMTSLGPGYSVFVPYPEPEAYQVRCQLRVRFTSAEGDTVWSEALTMILEGPPRPGSEPNFWSSSDAQALVGRGNQIEVTKRSGTPAQLKASASSEAAPRKLRSETFSLSELQQVGYEVPVRRTSASATSQRKPVRNVTHPLAVPLDENDSASFEKGAASSPSAHPFEASRAMRSGKAHPLEATLERRETPVRSHPLTRSNSATMEDSPRFLLARPHETPASGSSLKSLDQTAQTEQPSREEVASQSVADRAKLQTAAMQLRSAQSRNHRQTVVADASPVYGEWQSIAE